MLAEHPDGSVANPYLLTGRLTSGDLYIIITSWTVCISFRNTMKSISHFFLYRWLGDCECRHYTLLVTGWVVNCASAYLAGLALRLGVYAFPVVWFELGKAKDKRMRSTRNGSEKHLTKLTDITVCLGGTGGSDGSSRIMRRPCKQECREGSPVRRIFCVFSWVPLL